MRTFVSPGRALFFALALWPVAANAQNIITTVAGGGVFTGSATSVDLVSPIALAQDAAGNTYISVNQASVILRVDSTGQASVFAGNGSSGFSGDGGPAINASLFNPTGLAVDRMGNIFFADTLNQRIRRVNASGIITTVAGNGTFGFSGDGGLAINASLGNPHAVALDNAGNIFIADTANRRIRRVDAAGIITTVAGTGAAGSSGDGLPAINATLRRPFGVSFDAAGNLFIADTNSNRIREVAAVNGAITPNSIITTVAGNGTPGFTGDNGPATSAELNFPRAVAFDSQGNMYIADSNNSVIREVFAVARLITPQSTITTVAGVGTVFGFSGDSGPATSARLNFPTGALVDSVGNLFIADANNLRVRKVAAPITPNGIITTFAGGGTGGDGGVATAGILGLPVELAFDSTGNLYIGDASNDRIRKVAAPISSSSIITTVAGNVNQPGNFSGDGVPAINAGLCFPQGVAVDSAGNIFIADSCNNRIREVSASSGLIFTLVGTGVADYTGDNGPAGQATLNFPEWVAFDSAGNLFIADTFNNVIRKVTATGGVVTPTSIITTVAGNFMLGGTFSGDGGPATGAGLNGPEGLAIDSAGNLIIADSFNNRIRRVDTSGTINTVVGNGTAAYAGDSGPATTASINTPNAVTVDRFGNILIPDSGNNVVRRVDHSTGIITTLAGTGTQAFSGDGGPANLAALDQPAGVALDSSGTFYVADAGNNRVRRFQLSIQLFPASLDFGSAPPGFTSQPQRVTLTNLSGAPLTFTSPIAIAGTNSGDFAQSNTCPSASLAPGSSCTITLTFTPTGMGPRLATLTVADSDPTSPQQVPLSGTGATAPAGVLTPSRLDFGTLAVGKSVSQTITLANPGNVTLQIFGIALSDFFNFSESDTCAGAVVAGGMCTITVTFQPTENIPFTATLTVTDNAADSPQVVSLSGTGGPGPNVSLFPQSLSFGNQLIGSTSAPQSVLVFNNGSAPLTISSIQPGPDFALGGDCAQGIQISQGNSCSLTVNFVPTKAGSLAESIVISDNAPGSPHVVSLSGTGVAPAPVAGLSAPALNFGSQAIGTTSVAQQVVVTNAGTAPLTFGVNGVTIAPAGNFAIPAGSDACSTRSLAPAATCTVSVIFQPQASGPLSATLMFTDNAADSPQMVQLSGQGLAPLATLSTTSISFGVELAGTASGTQPVILGNAGTATLTIASISPPSGFTETDNCNGSVAARASCVIQVTFAPASVGGFSGNLVITDNAPGGGQQTVQLSGTAVNFSLTGGVTSAQAVAGQTVNYSMMVTPAQSFSGVVQLSCASSPSGPSCMVTPSAMSLSGAARPLTVTVQTVGRGGMGPRQKNWPPMGGFRLQVHLLWPVWLLTLALLVWLVKTHRRRVAVMTSAALLAFVLVFEVACGGGATSSMMPGGSGPSSLTNLTPPGNYVIIVTASSPGSPTETFSLTLTVTP